MQTSVWVGGGCGGWGPEKEVVVSEVPASTSRSELQLSEVEETAGRGHKGP